MINLFAKLNYDKMPESKNTLDVANKQDKLYGTYQEKPQIQSINEYMKDKKTNDDKYKKKPIQKALRMKVWETNIGNKLIGNCYCCERELKIDNFDCAHVIAERNGGTTTLDNLRVTCKPCNLSCHTMNLDDFKQSMNDKLISKKVVEHPEYKLMNTYDVKYAMINTYSYSEKYHNKLYDMIAKDDTLWNKWYEQYNIIKNMKHGSQYSKIFISEDNNIVNISVKYINQYCQS